MNHSSSFTHQATTAFKFGSYPFSPPRMFTHVYFIDGLLIDTGHVNMRKEICAELIDLPVDQMLITHHHEDHSGNTDAVQQLFDCPVYASASCAEIMKSPPPISPAQYLTWGKYDPYYKFKIAGDQVKTSNYTFDIIPIPGHAIDMIALHEKEQGWLFSADLYVYHRIKYFMRAESMAEQIESLKIILTLEFDQMYCSHYPQLDVDPKALLKKKLEFFEDFYGRVSDFYQKGYDAKRIMQSMGLKEDWNVRLLSLGGLSTLNMVRSVIRDEDKTSA